MARQLGINGDLAAQHYGTDLNWFYNQVRNGAPWDYKQNGSGFEAFGNFNYGYAGTRQGIPANVLLSAAGFAQLMAGTSDASFISNYFDDPLDQIQIMRGIQDAKNGCY